MPNLKLVLKGGELLMVPIDKLLMILRDKLESVLQAAQYQADKWVVLTSPIEPDGSPTDGISNKLVMFVVSLQNDAATGTFVPARQGAGDLYPISAPPLTIDTFVLLTANFTGMNYPAGLEMLSRAVSFFQSNPVFNHSNTPELPDGIDKMMVEFVSLDFAQANNLLMLTGLKCFPFLLYRIKRLTFSDSAISGVSPPIRAMTPATDAKAAA